MPNTLEILPHLLDGLWVTLALCGGGIATAVLPAFLAGLARTSRRWWVRAPAAAYVEFFRGTSALVQLFWAYFVLPAFGVRLSALATGILVLGLNLSAYGAEVVRGAVESVGKGQWDAARALGIGEHRTLWRVILPQAVPTMVPSFGNLAVELLKNTSLASMITLSDLTREGDRLVLDHPQLAVQTFCWLLVVYWVLARGLSGLNRLWERRSGRWRAEEARA